MTPTATKPSKLLIVSVVLNVFLIGAMLGGAYRWTTTRTAAPVAAVVHQRSVRAAADELPEARRLQLRQALRQTRRANRPLILGVQAGRRDVVAALRAQPFDPAALDAALERARAADVALRGQVEQTIGEFVAELSIEERTKLVTAMERTGLTRPGENSLE